MKKLLLGSLFAALLFSACNSGKGRLTVSIEGLPDDSLICSYFSTQTIRERGDMATFMVGGTRDGSRVDFSIDMPDKDQLYKVLLAPQSFRGDGPRQTIELFLLPDRKTHIDATYEAKKKTIEYSFDDPEQQRWVEASKEIEPLELRLDMLQMTAMMISPDRAPQDSLLTQIQALADTILKVKANYIGSHPDDLVSAYYLTSINDGYAFDSLYNLIGDQLKTGPLGEWLDLQKEAVGNMFAAEKAREAVQVGAVAPDFTLPDLEGKEFTLSSLYGKGKYTVIDFWGTWCSWCMKGMPSMKEAYAKNKAKVEFVGVDCGDKQDIWKQGVASLQLEWINVWTQNDDVSVSYGIQGFPTKLILDPQGTIVARFNGEDPAFYTTLDSLVNKQ